MDTPQSDLEAIRQLIAELASRVYRLERRLQMESPPSPFPVPTEAPEVSHHTATSITREPVSPPPRISAPPPFPPRRDSEPQLDLESRIGSHWLNRIGIAALLIGISYFLKFAFDNNWIGPTGRVAIGLLGGIAIVIWSERFRLKNYKAFSYSLKA